MEYLHLRNYKNDQLDKSSINKATNANSFNVPVPGGAIKISFDDSTKTCSLIGFTGKPTNIVLKSSYKKNSTSPSYKLTSIIMNSFNDCISLTSIEISASVTFIDPTSFIGLVLIGGCISLIKITVDPANKVYESDGYNLFNKGKTELIQYACGQTQTSYTIPSTVKTIGPFAFAGCVSLTSIKIPSSVKTISNFAFYECTQLTNIQIPSSVTSIGNNPFTICKSLTTIIVDPDNTAYETDRSCLFDKGKTKLISYIPGQKQTSYSIPSTVKTIGLGAFESCINLTKIQIPPTVQFIGDGAFRQCKSLTSIEIPSGVKTINVLTFNDCISLTNVQIPSSVTSIGTLAFNGCKSLTSIKIPSNVTFIDGTAFSYCKNLKNFIVDPTNKYYETDGNNLFNKGKTKLIYYALGQKQTSYTIPSTVKTIESGAFCYCDNLTSINVANGNKSFVVVNNTLYDSSKKTLLISIQNGILTIPSTVINITEGAFICCRNISSININSNPNFSIDNQGILYDKTKNQLIYCPDTKTGSIIIPSTVTNIYSHALINCIKLSSVTIYTFVVPFCYNSLPSTLSTVNLIGNYSYDLLTLFIPFKELQQIYPNVKEKPMTIYYNKANASSFKLEDQSIFWDVTYTLKESPTVIKDVDLDLVDENKLNTQSYLRTKLLLAKIVH